MFPVLSMIGDTSRDPLYPKYPESPTLVVVTSGRGARSL